MVQSQETAASSPTNPQSTQSQTNILDGTSTSIALLINTLQQVNYMHSLIISTVSHCNTALRGCNAVVVEVPKSSCLATLCKHKCWSEG